MGEIQRVYIRKLFVGRAGLFGLYYGLIIGIIFASIFIIFASWAASAIDIFSFSTSHGQASIAPMINMSSLFSSGIVIVILIAVLSSLFAMIFALIYNLASKMHGPIHMQIAEYDYLTGK